MHRTKPFPVLSLLALCLLATPAALAHGAEDHGGKSDLMGTITAIDGATVTVAPKAGGPSVVVGLDAKTRIERKRNSAKRATLSPGDRVVIHARKGQDGTLTAVVVKVAAGQKPAAAAARCSCPMHPDIVGAASDTCSKCGMALVCATADKAGAKPKMGMRPGTESPSHDGGHH